MKSINVISGASKGIGEFLFQSLDNSTGIYLNTKPKDGKSYKQVDLTSDDQISNFINNLPESKINFIHCAGISLNGITHKYKTEDWETTISTNLTSAFKICKYILPIMRKVGYGRIIFCSSVVPQIGVPGTSAYAASKSGLWGLTKVVAKENALKGITCNCLNLGYIDIGMTKTAIPCNIQSELKESIPCKKFGNPSNVLNAVNFIINSDYVNGSLIDINGGLI